jgi:hypothetical protein
MSSSIQKFINNLKILEGPYFGLFCPLDEKNVRKWPFWAKKLVFNFGGSKNLELNQISPPSFRSIRLGTAEKNQVF